VIKKAKKEREKAEQEQAIASAQLDHAVSDAAELLLFNQNA
jgi:hypothetical protein